MAAELTCRRKRQIRASAEAPDLIRGNFRVGVFATSLPPRKSQTRFACLPARGRQIYSLNFGEKLALGAVGPDDGL
jgi:hypothetical protein